IAPGRRQYTAESRLELLAEACRAPLVHQKRQPRLASRLARAMIAEDQRDRGARIGRLVGRHEGVERRRESRPTRSLLTADRDVQSGNLDSVTLDQRRRHRDVLSLAACAVLTAAGDRDIELARQVRELLVAEKDPLERGGDRRGVEELVWGEAGGGTA